MHCPSEKHSRTPAHPRRHSIMVVIWALFLVAAGGRAQNAGGEVIGRVTDIHGSPLPGVLITLTSSAGQSTAVGSGDFGDFRFEALPAGRYSLRAEMAGFDRFEQEGLAVSEGTPAAIALEMKIARPASTAAKPVEEKAEAVGPLQLGAAQPFQDLALGNLPEPEDGPPSEPPGSRPFLAATQDPSVAGDSSETLLINGSINFGLQPGSDGSAPDFANNDKLRSLQERLGSEAPKRSPFFQGGMGKAESISKAGNAAVKAAQAGQERKAPNAPASKRAGGAPKAAALRGRANRIQGQAFFNLRNSLLDARPYALTGVKHDKPDYGHDRFGATLGGPFHFPGIPKSPQPPTFLLNYTGARGNSSNDSTSSVPLPEERTGNFENSLQHNGQPVRIYDPLSAATGGALTPFPGNRIPASRIDPAALELLRFIPQPNQPGRVQNYFLQKTAPYNNHQFTARFNARLGRKVAWNADYSLARNRGNAVGIFPALNTSTRVTDQGLDLGANYTLRKGFSNHLRLRFNRTHNEGTNPYAYTTDVVGMLGIQGLSRAPINFGIPNILFTNFGSLRLANPSLRRQRVWGINDNLRLTVGPHSHHFGVEYRYTSTAMLTDENARGTFVFSGFATSTFDERGNPVSRTGLDFADFLLGLPQNSSRRYGGGLVDFRSSMFNVFYVDDWRVRPNLTLNLGLRYEFVQPPREAQDRIANLDLPADISAAALILPGQTGPYTGVFPRSLIDSDRNNLAPRVGLAYRPLRRANLVLRAGYGIFYNLGIYAQVAPKLADQPPFAVAQNLLTSLGQPLTLHNGFPTAPDTTIRNTYAVDRHYRVGYVQSWNLTLQKEFRRGWVMETGYVGTKGTKLDLLRAPNRAPRGAQLNTEQRRLIGYAENFIFETSGAASNYHSLQVRVTRRLSQGYSLSADYILGKSIDSASNIGGGAQLVVQDDRYLRGERGLSSFDVRHLLNLSTVYQLPFGLGRKYLSARGWRAQAFGNWSLAGGAAIFSGSPFTARILGNATNNSGTGGLQSERASATGLPVALPSAERSISHYFNTAAFQLPVPGNFGNAGRNTIIGPGSMLLNMTLTHDVRISEKGRTLSFVWQINNLLNTPNYRGLSTVVNSSSFGRVTGVKPMRTMEMTLRFRF